MAINKKLISFATQAQFDLKLNAGDIDNRSIVFIEDKKRIWTHGVYFDTSWNYITGTPDTLAGYNITDAAKKINSLYYVEGNTTGTAGAWTGSVPEITSLYAGLTIAYKIGVAGASTTNLNLNGLGNKLVRRNTSNLTTHLPVGTVVLLTYDGTRWVWADYHTNTTYAAMSVAEGTAGTVGTLRTMRADYLKQIIEHHITNTVPSSHILGSHSDVTITSNSTGEILKWNGTNWINNTLAEAGIASTGQLNNYLPLAGGTLTGSTYNMLELKRSSAAGSSILFSNSTTSLGKVGFTLNGNLIIGTGVSTDGVANMLSITPSGVAQFYGNISTSGLITGTGFSKTGATDAHMLLGSGGHKAISDFVPKAWTGAGDGAEIWMKSDVTTAGHSLGLHFTNSTNSTTVTYQSRIQSRRGSGTYSDLIFAIRDTDIMLEILGQDRRVNILNELTVQNNEVYHTGNLNISNFNTSLITSTSTAGITNVNTTNSNTYLNLIQGTSAVSSTQITGSDGVSVSSNTSGRVTIVGVGDFRDYGLGRNTVLNIDLADGKTETGLYTSSTSDSSSPMSGSSGSVLNLWSAVSGGANAQMWMKANNTSGEDVYVRHSNNAGVFYPWQRLWHSGNLANGTTAQYIRGDGSLATYANTTYSEITAAQTVSASSSVVGLITGRRLKYAFDNITAANASSATLASTLTINSSASASWFNILWNSDTTVYGSASNKLRVQPSTGSITSGGTITASGGNSGEWNSAYGWGNHASGGYLKSLGNASVGYDLNDFNGVGVYGISSTNASSILNIPYSGSQTSSVTSIVGGGYGLQLYNVNSGVGKLYFRGRASGEGNWGSWNEVWHSGNLANGTTAQYIRGDGSLATYANTTYSAGTLALLQAGANTSNRVWSAKILNDFTDGKYLQLSGGTLTGEITAPKILINKAGNTASGISWYNSTYTAWQDYMANSATTGNGVKGNITAPSGTLVTAWARRSFIEGTAGYGWTFEKGTNSSTAPSVVAEIRASDGAAKFGGNVTAPTFVGALSGNASSATYASAVTLTADNATNATRYPLFVDAATGNKSPRTDTGFTYNPSTGILTSTRFAGSGASLTALNATQLTTGTVPDARLSGVYTGFTHRIDGANTIFTTPSTGTSNSSARTAFGVAEYRSSSSAQVGAIVFIAPFNSTTIMKQMEIEGMLYSPSNVVKIIINNYSSGLTKQINLGSLDIPVRIGQTADSKFCVILGDVTTSWSYPHFMLSRVMISHSSISDDKCYGWSVKLETNLTGYLNVYGEIANSPIVTDITGSATKLQTARNINGVSFDGSKNITITASTTATLTRGSYLTGSNFNGSTARTWAVDATSDNTASKVVARNASGNFSAGTITATLSGNASSATKVNNKLILKFDTGTTENTNLYTYDGSAAKTIDIKAGSNVALAKTANTITISSTNTNTTYSAMSVAEGTTGTATSLRTMRADYLKQIIQYYDTNTTYTAGTNIQISGTNVISATDTKYTHPSGIYMSSAERTKLSGIATGANNYTLPVATATVIGGVELFSNTVQSVAANAVTTTASRTYGIQLNSAGQAVVNVPWSNTNTTYSAGTGLSLSGTTFGQAITTSSSGSFVTGITQTANGFQVNLGTPPNTNTTYSAMSVAEGQTGTATSSRTMRADYLKQIIQYYAGDSTSGIRVGASGTAANTAVTSPYIKVVDNEFYREQFRLIGGTNVTITSDASKNITITAVNTNTTYTTGTIAQLNAGNDTTGRLHTAKLLNDWVNPKLEAIPKLKTTNWEVSQVGTELQFKYNGVIKQRMLSNGTIVATGGMTALST